MMDNKNHFHADVSGFDLQDMEKQLRLTEAAANELQAKIDRLTTVLTFDPKDESTWPEEGKMFAACVYANHKTESRMTPQPNHTNHNASMTPQKILDIARQNNPVYKDLLAQLREWAEEGHPDLHIKKVENKHGYLEWPYDYDKLDSALQLLRTDGFTVSGDVYNSSEYVIKIFAISVKK